MWGDWRGSTTVGGGGREEGDLEGGGGGDEIAMFICYLSHFRSSFLYN